jgi:cytochrome P450
MIPGTLFPIGSTVRQNALAANPYSIFEALQTHEPISYIPEFKLWFITRRADVLAVLGDPVTFTVESPHSLLEDTFGKMMLSTDGDEQYRLRYPFNAPFLPRAVRTSAVPAIESLAHELIDSFPKGQFNLVTAFSDPLALRTVTAVLGIPIEDFARFRGWYDDFARALGNFIRDANVRREGQRAAVEFAGYIAGHLKRLRSEPDESVLSQVLYDTPQTLTEREIKSAAMVIIFGGLETTSAMLSNTIWALLNHPEALDAVRRDNGLLSSAVEEALRWESPVQTCTRHLTRHATVQGVEIGAGETVQCMIGAANRDPAHFDHPEQFDIYRANAADHLAFAVGKHYCLGAALARLEGEIGLRILLERLPHLRLDPAHPTAPYGHEFRSPPALDVLW